MTLEKIKHLAAKIRLAQKEYQDQIKKSIRPGMLIEYSRGNKLILAKVDMVSWTRVALIGGKRGIYWINVYRITRIQK